MFVFLAPCMSIPYSSFNKLLLPLALHGEIELVVEVTKTMAARPLTKIHPRLLD